MPQRAESPRGTGGYVEGSGLLPGRIGFHAQSAVLRTAERTRNLRMFVESFETEQEKFLKERRQFGIDRADLGFDLLERGSTDVPWPALPSGVRIASHRLLEQNLRHLDRIAIPNARATQ